MGCDFDDGGDKFCTVMVLRLQVMSRVLPQDAAVRWLPKEKAILVPYCRATTPGGQAPADASPLKGPPPGYKLQLQPSDW